MRCHLRCVICEVQWVMWWFYCIPLTSVFPTGIVCDIWRILRDLQYVMCYVKTVFYSSDIRYLIDYQEWDGEGNGRKGFCIVQQKWILVCISLDMQTQSYTNKHHIIPHNKCNVMTVSFSPYLIRFCTQMNLSMGGGRLILPCSSTFGIYLNPRCLRCSFIYKKFKKIKKI